MEPLELAMVNSGFDECYCFECVTQAYEAMRAALSGGEVSR